MLLRADTQQVRMFTTDDWVTAARRHDSLWYVEYRGVLYAPASIWVGSGEYFVSTNFSGSPQYLAGTGRYYEVADARQWPQRVRETVQLLTGEYHAG